MNGGDVIGNYGTISVTEGAFRRIEFGYIAELQKQGDDHTHSVNSAPLWSEAMHIVHGKANLIPENAFHTRWVPAISAGAIGRFHVNNGQKVGIFDIPTSEMYAVRILPFPQV